MSDGAILIRPPSRDLGDGFVVRRALPSVQRRAIGPFVFLDEMGPVSFGPGQGLDVRPHPHIGLSTITYLFEGEIEHRDSVGSVQVIRAGDVNWMTAGRGIVHSERSPSPRLGGRLHGLQFWAALPAAEEERDPFFAHHPAAVLPVWEERGVAARLVLGEASGRSAPVETFGAPVLIDLHMEAGAAWTLPAPGAELGLYVVSGAIEVQGETVEPNTLAVLSPSGTITLKVKETARAALFGGEPLDGPRRLWWNFVSTRSERLEQAKADWRAMRMGAVPGDDSFIPLPDR